MPPWRALVAVSLAGVSACSLFLSADEFSGGRDPSPDASTSAADANLDEGGGSDAPGAADAGGDAAPATACDGGGDPDLVGYWPLDEGAGTTAHDCSGHGHDGVVLSMPSGGAWTGGAIGGGFHADSAAGCIDLGTPADLLVESVAFTVTAWVDVITFGGPQSQTRYIVGRSHNADFTGWRLAGDAPTRLTFEIATGSDAGSSLASSADGQTPGVWTHLAAVFEPSASTRLYVNGALVDTRPQTIASILVDETATVRIGCRADTDRYFDGTIDEVRLYRRALTVAEITTLATR